MCTILTTKSTQAQKCLSLHRPHLARFLLLLTYWYCHEVLMYTLPYCACNPCTTRPLFFLLAPALYKCVRKRPNLKKVWTISVLYLQLNLPNHKSVSPSSVLIQQGSSGFLPIGTVTRYSCTHCRIVHVIHARLGHYFFKLSLPYKCVRNLPN